MTPEQIKHYATLPEDARTIAARLLSSPLLFAQLFYKELTGRDFIVPQPIGRESHVKTIYRELLSAYNGETQNLAINVAPGCWKSTLLTLWIAWSLANYPDSNFIYASYSAELAASHTVKIRDIVQLALYRKYFGVEIDPKCCSGSHFKTLNGGEVFSGGTTGTITGFNAGLPILERFSGALIIDDAHKPDETANESIRNKVKDNFVETLSTRCRSGRVPKIVIGQILHEDDIFSSLREGYDGNNWKFVCLPSLDENDNPLNPVVHSSEMLKTMREKQPYVFWAQHMQKPSPAGGGLFKEEDFMLMEQEPDILATFITADTAETANTINDPSVFSLWGLYRIKYGETETGEWGLHWMACEQMWVEPIRLESEFMSFYMRAHTHKVKPRYAGIEEKSTGVTLISNLKKIPGLKVLTFKPTRSSGSKGDRFIDMQKYIGSKLISLPKYAKHTTMCVEHMKKINAAMTAKHDDICDTCYQAIKLALIDKLIQHIAMDDDRKQLNPLYSKMNKNYNAIQAAKNKRYGSPR